MPFLAPSHRYRHPDDLMGKEVNPDQNLSPGGLDPSRQSRNRGRIKSEQAFAHLLMLQAITLHATAKHTLAIRRTLSLPIPWAPFLVKCWWCFILPENPSCPLAFYILLPVVHFEVEFTSKQWHRRDALEMLTSGNHVSLQKFSLDLLSQRIAPPSRCQFCNSSRTETKASRNVNSLKS
ncbi:MAG: hypothetical protein A4E58_01437 [Syntrophorhabdus sp. PtaB.Bin006]|nr:MAG: hypothetical protein A4E58_01437 [Syntrophorhabdus sp. PtaB.Bin006]